MVNVGVLISTDIKTVVMHNRNIVGVNNAALT